MDNAAFGLCSAIAASDRLATLSALDKGFDLNQTVDWDSANKTLSDTPAPETEAQETLIYKALPLNLAVIHGHLDIVMDLVNAGANPSKKDSRNR